MTNLIKFDGNEFYGNEYQNANTLVSLGGKLPYKMEIRTAVLLDLLQKLLPSKIERKKVNAWLYSRTRPGFYIELSPQLHLAYADQRDGHGTQHYWRLFFDDKLRQLIESVSKKTAIVVGVARESQTETRNYYQGLKEYYGMYFRSEVEVVIAKELVKAKVLFFANLRGYINAENKPISDSKTNGRIELDFLVFKDSKCICLEVDGSHHNENPQIERDYVRDRLVLGEGIPTVRFTAQECFNQPQKVVEELLNILSGYRKF